MASQLLTSLILDARFSEWGALLLHSEVLSASAYLSSLLDHLDPSLISAVAASLDKLHYALKILTLDAPGDIRRYTIPDFFTEVEVRNIMARRVDFSKEAVRNVRITFAPAPSSAPTSTSTSASIHTPS
ncbi:hypothetical protein B484DRAFT_483298 [Ochromonadaceae sp. CCMP2298]|nr:hypothetical protein B484DRAFT_483298 [Ochromonadaceae sp. CCMP2298]